MHKKGFNFFGMLVWFAFVLIVVFLFNSIIVDLESNKEQYQLLLFMTAAIVLVSIVLYFVVKMKQSNAKYVEFEKLFPEGISIIEKQASQFSELGAVAVFQHYFVSNWEFDFVDLNEVENMYYERTMAIRGRTGVIAGDNPQLVFVMHNQDKKIIKITPVGMQDYLPKIFEAMYAVNSELTFGKNQDELIDYLPVFAQMR